VGVDQVAFGDERTGGAVGGRREPVRAPEHGRGQLGRIDEALERPGLARHQQVRREAISVERARELDGGLLGPALEQAVDQHQDPQLLSHSLLRWAAPVASV
jgi:hypothetical protein